jgi:hypothetical protein
VEPQLTRATRNARIPLAAFACIGLFADSSLHEMVDVIARMEVTGNTPEPISLQSTRRY